MQNAPLTIQGIQARPVLVPIRRPPRSASGAIPMAPLVLIDLLTAEGISGRAYVFAFTPWALAPIVACIEAAAEIIRGQPLAPLDLTAMLQARLRLMDTPGLVGIAIAGVDMAAWDAQARAQQLPLARLLGGNTTSVRAYNSCGLWIGPVEALADEAQELVSEGDFGAVKLRLGRADSKADLEAVHAVRARLDSATELMVDYNQSLDTNAAIARGRQLEGVGLSWIEEPIAHDNYAGYTKIKAALTTPIQTGENLLDTRKFAQAIALDSLDYVMPDVQRIGGVSGWLRAAAIAQAHDINMSSHLFPEFSQHLLAVTPTAHWLEYMDWANPILQNPVKVIDGHAHIPDTAGAGVDWDEDAVARYLVTP
jgi:mandelate racemase